MKSINRIVLALSLTLLSMNSIAEECICSSPSICWEIYINYLKSSNSANALKCTSRAAYNNTKALIQSGRDNITDFTNHYFQLHDIKYIGDKFAEAYILSETKNNAAAVVFIKNNNNWKIDQL